MVQFNAKGSGGTEKNEGGVMQLMAVQRIGSIFSFQAFCEIHKMLQ